MTIIEILIILAVWRLTSLLANEDGPFEMFKKFREFTGFDCFWCISVWTSLAIVIFTYHQFDVVRWLAYSAGAIIIEVLIFTRSSK